ncbi:MAG: complex I NDUFA9 subunit family protein [Candidatus Sedimenticola endophacoides]
MKGTRVCILGGTGFVGRHLSTRLSAAGIACTIPSRHPQRHRDMLTTPGVKLVALNPYDPQQLQEALSGCRAAVNLVGILSESAHASFQRVHVELPNLLLRACKESGVPRLLHMSALNANEANGPSRYLKTKGLAENRTLTLGKPQVRVTSFRPSVIFGEEDSFFNRFAALLRLPGPFPLACPEARFAPVFVGDVARAFVAALDDPATWGRHYELCGPRAFTLRQLLEYTAACGGRRK